MIAYLSGGMENAKNELSSWIFSCSSRVYCFFDNLNNNLLRIYTIDK